MRPGHAKLHSESGEEEFHQKPRKWMMPAKISYSASSIPFTMSKPHGHLLTLTEALQKLRRGDLRIDSFPPIEVVAVSDGTDTKWYSLNNRRLWIFKEYGQRIPVIVGELTDDFCDHLTGLPCSDTICIVDHVEENHEYKESASFLGSVLRWSIFDIQNEQLHCDLVRLIPDTFKDLATYFDAFRWPLIEDTRAQVLKGLQMVEQAGRRSSLLCSGFELQIPENSTPLSQFQLKKFLLTVDLKQSRLRALEWKHKKWDLVLICSSLPQDFGELMAPHECFTLGVLTSPGGQSKVREVPSILKVTAFCPANGEGKLFQAMTRSSRKWHVLVLCNISTGLRIWDALNPDIVRNLERLQLVQETLVPLWKVRGATTVTRKMHETPGDGMKVTGKTGAQEMEGSLIHGTTMQEVSANDRAQQELSMLYREDDSDFDEPPVLEANPKPVKWRLSAEEWRWQKSVEFFCLYRFLNDTQGDAVLRTASALLEGEEPLVRLVKGPPGTGKTATLVTYLSIITCLEYRTLVCAPANRAICEIAQRFLEFFNLRQGSNLAQYFDFHTMFKIEGRSCKRLKIGDVVLVGNDERLEVDGSLSRIYLPSRLKRLSLGILGSRSWRQMFEGLLKLVRCPLSDFASQPPDANEFDELDRAKSYLHYLRDRLIQWGTQLIVAGHILCSDLPGGLLSPAMSGFIKSVCDATADVLEGFPHEDLTDTQILNWYIATSRSGPLENHSEVTEGSNAVVTAPVISDPDYNAQIFFRSKMRNLLMLLSSKCREGVLGCISALTDENMEDKCLKHACIVFCTISSAGRTSVQNSGPFMSLVIDEASQLVEAETAIVTQLHGLQQALLVGDEKQLPATVVSMLSRERGYGRSLFERLMEVDHPCQLLTTQYRMHPEISIFPNDAFYKGLLQDGPNVLGGTYRKPYQEQYGPYLFVDVSEGLEEKGRNDNSWKNLVEIEVLHYLLTKLQKVCAENGISSISVGIITPYASQVDALSRRLRDESACTSSDTLKRFPNLRVEIKTVDGFQGGERDVILFSTVRANFQRKIGFLTDCRRLNVAITRGRYCVWIVGHAETLAGGRDGIWRQLINNASKRNCILDAKNDKDMSQCYQHVKKAIASDEEGQACLAKRMRI